MRAAEEKRFLAIGDVAAALLAGAAAVAHLGREIGEILTLRAADGDTAPVAALARAVEFRRWQADYARSILAAAEAAPLPAPPGSPSC